MDKRLLNPYQNVDWSCPQYKAAFHTHAANTEIGGVAYGCHGSLLHADIIDSYHAAGYKVLAFTEHDFYGGLQTGASYSTVTSYPWDIFQRHANSLGMTDIEGKELSRNDHVVSLFNDLADWQGVGFDEIPELLREIKRSGGLSILVHPGRYKRNPGIVYAWHKQAFNSLLGIEVYNQGQKHPEDLTLWDRLIEKRAGDASAKAPTVWGFSNDDMHVGEHKFREYQYVISPERTKNAIKNALRKGNFYFCYEPNGDGVSKTPKINTIIVNENNKTVNIEASNFDSVKWVVNRQATSNQTLTHTYNENQQYFRAVLENEHGLTYTQPWILQTTYARRWK